MKKAHPPAAADPLRPFRIPLNNQRRLFGVFLAAHAIPDALDFLHTGVGCKPKTQRQLAYHVGARKSFDLETSVREGLLFAELFPEMGFDAELLFQGPVEEAHKKKLAALLAFYGIRLPFVPVRDRPAVTDVLGERRYDLIYGCDSLRDEVAAAGIPLVPFGAMLPGFAGLVRDIRTLEKILEAR